MRKSWRVLGFLLILFLNVGSVSADAPTTTGHPAKEPWSIEYVSRYATSDVGRYVAIAHHPKTGKAYISYYDDRNADLVMAYEVTPGTGNCPGNANWVCEHVDTDTLAGKFTSIDVIYVPPSPPIPGFSRIAISYYHESTQSLRVATYNGFTGNWTINTVDDSDLGSQVRGTYTSVKYSMINDTPIIAYHVSSSLGPYGAVKIANWVGSGSGDCGDGNNWHCVTVASSDNLNYGSHVSMDINQNDGTAYIAFYEPYYGSVILAHYQGFGGSCSNPEYECLTIDELNHPGQYLSLHAPDNPSDVMRLVYYDEDVEWVKYAEYVGSGGNCYGSDAYDCYYLDLVGMPPGNIGLAQAVDAQGLPIIAYMDAHVDTAPAQLRIARPAAAYGEESGNCGELRDGEILQYWICDTIDNGDQYADEAQFVAVSVSPAGLATIAYSEYNSYDDETYLKVAQQHIMAYMPMIIR